jgi:hypothetical protein
MTTERIGRTGADDLLALLPLSAVQVQRTIDRRRSARKDATMADDLHTIEIAFKNSPNPLHVKKYRITTQDRDQLLKHFSSGTGRGSCTVQTEDGQKRTLMVDFADVLYIA